MNSIGIIVGYASYLPTIYKLSSTEKLKKKVWKKVFKKVHQK